jgi:hypothetical protein
MNEIFGQYEKAVLGSLATAIAAVITLAAVPKGDLDGNLADAALLYFWCIPLLAGGILVDAAVKSDSTKESIARWHMRALKVVRAVWFAIGIMLWIEASRQLTQHFGIPSAQAYGMFFAIAIPYWLAGYRLERKSAGESIDSE